MNKYSKTRVLAECALMIALGTILAQIKIYEMPNGGSVTLLSMLPFIMISLRHGIKWGIPAGIANSLLQMAIGGIYPTPAGTALAMVGEVFLDYILAFGVLSLAVLFAKPFKSKAVGVAVGTVAVCFLRFACAFLSGVIVWGSFTDGFWPVIVYSLTYNASYMVPETILTTVAAYILARKAPALFS